MKNRFKTNGSFNKMSDNDEINFEYNDSFYVRELNDDGSFLNKVEGSEIWVVALNNEPVSYSKDEKKAFQLANQLANRLCLKYNQDTYLKNYFIDETDGVFTILYKFKIFFHIYDTLSDVIMVYKINEGSL